MTPEEERKLDQALRTLRGVVKLTVHSYERSNWSDAGNCWCGYDEKCGLHPHVFTPRMTDPFRCVCGKPPNHRIHIAAAVETRHAD